MIYQVKMTGYKFNQNIKQGTIILADLEPVKGSEQGGYRPVIVLQNNVLNKHLNTVIIAPITKNLKAKGLFTTYFFERKLSGLNFDSIALLFQIRTIDKSRLKKKLGIIPQPKFLELKRQLGLIF